MPIHIFSLITLHNPELYTYLDNHTQRPQPHSKATTTLRQCRWDLQLTNQNFFRTKIRSAECTNLLWECDVLHGKQTVMVMVCLDGTEPCWYGAWGAMVLPFTGLGHGDGRSRRWGRQVKEARTAGSGAKRIKFWGVLPSCTHIRTKIRIIPPNKNNWQEKMAHVPVWNLHTIDYQHNRSTVTNWFCSCAKGSSICTILTCDSD